MSETINKIRTLLGIQDADKEKEEITEVIEPKVELQEEVKEEEEAPVDQNIEEKLSMIGLDAEMINKVLEVVNEYMPKTEEEEDEEKEEEVMAKMSSDKSEVEILANELKPVFEALFSRIEAIESEPANTGVSYSPKTTTATEDIDLTGMKTKQRAFALINKYKN